MPSARSNPQRRAAQAALRVLHADIDREAGRVAKRHAERLRCGRGCSACCLDELTVRPIEADRIREAHPALPRDAAAGPVGACAFLDAEGACRIYDDRPSVCRSQGLPLRVLYESEAGEIEERRDICFLNEEGGPPLDSLDEADCWLVGPFELRLLALDEAFAGAEAPRVALRSLLLQGGQTEDD